MNHTKFNIKIAALALAGSQVAMAATSDYQGSRFSEVWAQVASDPYETLPDTQVSFTTFYGWLKSKIRADAERTLSDHSDLLPYFDKLVHPTGICLAGTWTITEDSPYTGYFAKGAKGLIIARASEAMGYTDRGDYRAFGLAGKVYPTTDENHAEPLETGNFFTVDDLGGTLNDYYTDAKLRNEPKQTRRYTILGSLLEIAGIIKAFSSADGNPGYRPLYEISQLGLTDKSKAVTPKWIQLRALEGQSVDAVDYRHELQMQNRGGKLSFAIEVAEAGDKQWRHLGQIDFTKDALTESCDHRLHFHHPRLNGGN